MKFIVLLFILFSCSAFSQKTYEVMQKNKAFTVNEITIKVGDKVKFTNDDDFFHNVFSLSDTAFFDLGSFPKGEYKDIVFEQAGVVDVECAIHPNMKMKITVTNN